jgi:hypothetical protein
MSMVAYFREVSEAILGRLREDPSLVEDVVLAGAQGAAVPDGLSAELGGAVAHMKAALLDQMPALLPTMPLPPEQRDALAALTPAQQHAVFRTIVDQLATSRGWDDMLTTGPALLRVPLATLGPLVGIEKAWHGLHFLLAADAEPTATPLGQAILGGEPLGDDLGYGPARVHGPAQVAAVAAALASTSVAELRGRYDPAALRDARIYPGTWDDPDDRDWLLAAFDDVRRFYAEAAARGSAALIYLT